MNRNPRRFVDNNHLIIFVYDSDRCRGDRGFVSMESMGDDIAVFDNVSCGRDYFAIDNDGATSNRIFLHKLVNAIN